MKPIIFCTALILTIIVTGCASGPPAGSTQQDVKPKKLLYNAKERKMLTYCIGIADIVWQVALKRKQGKSIIDVKKEYEGREETRLIHATIHKVYRESFKSPWRYTETFYNECANNMAKVNIDRSGFANFCFQNQLIAGIAFTFKQNGKPQEEAYGFFRDLKSESANDIIDKVYNSDKRRSVLKMETWNSCMDKIS